MPYPNGAVYTVYIRYFEVSARNKSEEGPRLIFGSHKCGGRGGRSAEIPGITFRGGSGYNWNRRRRRREKIRVESGISEENKARVGSNWRRRRKEKFPKSQLYCAVPRSGGQV